MSIEKSETAMTADPLLPAVYFNWVGCSRWTNATKNMMIHIAKNNSGEPLCEKHYKGGTLRREELNLNEVTCKKCLSLYGR